MVGAVLSHGGQRLVVMFESSSAFSLGGVDWSFKSRRQRGIFHKRTGKTAFRIAKTALQEQLDQDGHDLRAGLSVAGKPDP